MAITTAEVVARRFEISREAQDEFAAKSHQKAEAATAAGKFDDEKFTIQVPQRKKDPIIVNKDETPRGDTSMDVLAKLPTVFKKGGTVTPGNAPGLNDGAAAVVVMSREKAEALGCTVMAAIGAQASYGIDMKYVLVAPIWAIPKCLEKEGLGVGDVDLFEINEAFSGSTVAVLKELGLERDKVNVNGGSVALGHPIGASGCRVLITLLYEMIQQDKKTGLATLCLGGGEAVALVVKR